MRIDPDLGSRAPAVKPSSIEDKVGATATISYRNQGALFAYALWVNKVEQSHELQGESHQGLLSNHFYSKSYAPGTIQLSGQHDGQSDLQGLALFIRAHHEALMEHVGGFNTQNRSVAQDSSSFGLLMYLTVPSEGIACRGWIDKFTITRLGVFEQTPTFSFPFTVVYDSRSTDFKRSFIGQLKNGKVIDRPTPFTPQPKEAP